MVATTFVAADDAVLSVVDTVPCGTATDKSSHAVVAIADSVDVSTNNASNAIDYVSEVIAVAVNTDVNTSSGKISKSPTDKSPRNIDIANLERTRRCGRMGEEEIVDQLPDAQFTEEVLTRVGKDVFTNVVGVELNTKIFQYVYIYMYIYIYIYMCMYTYVCNAIRAYIHECMNICTCTNASFHVKRLSFDSTIRLQFVVSPK